MVKRGKIQVGVVPDAPEAVVSSEDIMSVASEAPEADVDAGDEDAAVGAEQNNRSPADHIPWAPLPPHESKRSTKDAPKSPSIVPQKRDADDVQHEDGDKVSTEVVYPCNGNTLMMQHAGPPGLRSMKRSFLKLPSTDLDAKPDSEDERVVSRSSSQPQKLILSSTRCPRTVPRPANPKSSPALPLHRQPAQPREMSEMRRSSPKRERPRTAIRLSTTRHTRREGHTSPSPSAHSPSLLSISLYRCLPL
jgi:hypothetical protein